MWRLATAGGDRLVRVSAVGMRTRGVRVGSVLRSEGSRSGGRGGRGLLAQTDLARACCSRATTNGASRWLRC